ncbi:MAG: glycosyltransferase family 2 protein [Anaerolineaceae bacterium]|jgi:glycosyltransferase involved in cell wall biosynthesis
MILEVDPASTSSVPLVSIGLPVYNGERFIQRALDSLLAQDYSNLEIIISDNSSTDRTGNICLACQEKDARVRYYRNDANIGMMGNFKRTLDLARGEYFMFAAHDDRWSPEFISSLLLDLGGHPESGVVMSALDVVDEENQLIKPVRLDQGDKSPNELGYFSMLLRLMMIWGGSTKSHHYYFYGLFRRSFLQKTFGFYVDTAFGDRMFIALLCLATPFRYVPKVLFYKTRHRDNQLYRYPTESFTKAFHSFSKLFSAISGMASMIILCPLVPWRRKVYAPIAVLGMTKIILFWLARYWRTL